MHEGTYVAGIDSGSASTDVVILDREGAIVSSEVVPTGGGAQRSAERSLAQALEKAGIARSDIAYVVATGYGRSFIDDGNESITEITCHARGAHHLDPDVRTIIDIGGQDSKVIRVDESGAVQNFVMNDKCAAGTGRFLEMMARTLDLSLEEMARLGMAWKHDLTISSMCTVFAESEVVSLVAENKAIPDIVHGLNNSVASKVATLVKRVGPEERFMMTGGVARNEGVVRALENRLGTSLAVYDEAQVCGALGAALFARDRWIGE
jgi:predicted CoA-substrate-specific enzyme activase